MRTVVPFDLERRQALLGRPHMIRHDRNRVVESNDLPHALDGLGGRVVQALQATAEHRRLRQRRNLHTRRAGVDAIAGPCR